MPDNNDFDFGPLDDNLPDFDLDDSELFSFDEPDTIESHEIPEDTLHDQAEPSSDIKRRTSQDFEPDMDALLLTAQSPMIIEGMKYLTLKDYSSKRHRIFLEAVKGVDLYIKIIERNPKNYLKLTKILNTDIDCKEVEKIAFNLYKNKYSTAPETADQKLKSFDIFRDKLKNAYDKSLISSSMVGIKKYFLLSGSLDQEKIDKLLKSNNPEFKSEVAKLNHNVKLAMGILQQADNEIAKGMKGKDINIFIIKASQLLYYFYNSMNNLDTATYYKRIYYNYKKYFVVR